MPTMMNSPKRAGSRMAACLLFAALSTPVFLQAQTATPAQQPAADAAQAPADTSAAQPAQPGKPADSKLQHPQRPGVIDTALKPVKAVASAATEVVKNTADVTSDAVKSVANAAWVPMKSAGEAISKGSALVGQALREEVLRMRDFFDVTLPGIAARNHLIIDIEPKAGDLVKHEYVRFPVEVRYGLAERWELYGGITPVVPNVFKDGPDRMWGPGIAKLGARYDMPCTWLWFQRISVGFEAIQPLAEPPIDLNDHYMHLRPYVTASRPMPGLKDTTLFVSALYDRTVMAPGHDDIIPPAVKRRDMIEVAPGLLYKPGQFGYFGRYEFRHWQEVDGYRLEHIGTVGMIWDMPLERSQKWHLPGKWQFELGLKTGVIEGESPDYGVHARVKWRTDWFRKKKPAG